jgi:hypothetical protein
MNNYTRVKLPLAIKKPTNYTTALRQLKGFNLPKG